MYKPTFGMCDKTVLKAGTRLHQKKKVGTRAMHKQWKEKRLLPLSQIS